MKDLIRQFPVYDWYQLLQKKAECSNFIDRSISSQLQVLLNEVRETQEAANNNNINEIRKEVLDILFNTFQLLYSLEKKWIIDEDFIKSSWKVQKQKIYKRSPFLLENRKVSVQEEERLRYLSKNQPIKPIE